MGFKSQSTCRFPGADFFDNSSICTQVTFNYNAALSLFFYFADISKLCLNLFNMKMFDDNKSK